MLLSCFFLTILSVIINRYIDLCNHQYDSCLKRFYHSKNIHCVQLHSNSAPTPGPSNHWSAFCLHQFLFLEHFIHMKLQYMYAIFHIWLLSLNVIFLRFTHLIAYITIFYCWIEFHYMDTPHFIYTFTS